MNVPIDEQYRLAELIRWHLEQPPLPNSRQWWIDETLRVIAADRGHPWRSSAIAALKRHDDERRG